MKEKIENSFKDLISALQVARLYAGSHPQFQKAVEKAYLSLSDILSSKEELVIGIIGEELAYDKDIFFDLSRLIKPMILYLKERGIERIAFYRGLDKEELSRFIAFLITPKEELKKEPQETLSFLGIKNITVGKIKVSTSSGIIQEAQRSVDYLRLYEDSLDNVTNSLDTVLSQGELDHLALRFTVTTMMDSLLGRYQEFLNFATMKRYDFRTFFHVVNVSILAMYFASKIGFAKDEVLDIGTAALFHDIGKLYISRNIIKKPAKLTDEEFAKIRSHVIVGAEILLKYVDTLGALPVVVCFEHHLKYDLTGYPKVEFYQRPHTASQIVSICDVYDALFQRRVYRSDYSPEMIYSIMMKEREVAFEPGLLDKFFNIIGVWPIGTIVALSDGRIALVREENEDDIRSPKVEVVAPQDKKESIDLKLAKDGVKIERSLNPLNEGREYFALIYPNFS